MDFVTFGMFIIDEIHYQPPKPPNLNVMGGGGLYAALGARLFRPPPSSSKVGWVVHQGHDFPSHIRGTIDSWGTSCQIIETPERPTTRAWNRYEPDGYRSFKYMNEKVRIDENSLTVEQLMSKTYHLICSADRCIKLVQGIHAKREELTQARDINSRLREPIKHRPLFIWEPLPALCKPSECQNFLSALKYVDVVSPNLDEYCSLLDVSIDLDEPDAWTLLRQKCEAIIGLSSETSELAVVVRLGDKGCCITQSHRFLRLPAYYEPESADRVIDPTGGGNAFLGGFAIGVIQSAASSRGAQLEEAALYGTVAASFAIEQIGAPSQVESSVEGELWNGAKVESRLEEYRERIARDSDNIGNKERKET
ncbi:MAG: hypothetical protein Q9219_006413 [cf. Caloplaca sp. 3 TL-2023]